MKQELYMKSSQTFRQSLAPGVMHSIQLLTMPYVSLLPFLRKAVLENPLLEIEGNPEEISFSIHDMEDRVYSRTASEGYQIRDPKSFESEEEMIRLEILMMKLEPDVQKAALAILEELDEYGYWRGGKEELCIRLGLSDEAVEKGKSAVQSIKPKGIGAKNLIECLQLQVDEGLEDGGLIKKIIKEHLEWADGRHQIQLQKEYKISSEQADGIVAYIRGLEPYPVNLENRKAEAVLIYPEISILCREDRLVCTLNVRTHEMLRVNEQYLKNLSEMREDTETVAYVRKCRSNAREMIENLKLRDQTLQNLAECLAVFQEDFFRYGPLWLKPMTLKTLAQRMKIGISTVSRCVQDKYIETEFGIFPLKMLFSSCLTTEDGREVSAMAVKAALQILYKKHKEEKFSDNRLAELLEKQGIRISRRTINKYRNERNELRYVNWDKIRKDRNWDV